MKLNGCELEMEYVAYITMIKQNKWYRRRKFKKYRELLKERLVKLEKDFDKNKISTKAYVIWKKMINDVL